jgi:hypothetical protein
MESDQNLQLHSTVLSVILHRHEDVLSRFIGITCPPADITIR